MNKAFYILILNLFMMSTRTAAQKINYGNNPAAGKYAPINGIKLYYETYGKGEPLLMFHGNGGNITAFEKQIPFFSKHYQVIAVDSRLQGKSGGSEDTLSYNMMADDFCALIDYLKLYSVYILGWSDGGIDAILVAMKCPAKVKCIAFTGANVVPDSSAISNAVLQGMRDVLNNKTTTAREKTLNRMMLNEPNIPYADLSKIKCRALVMAGDHDIIKLEHTINIYKSIPGANLCIFPDSYHHVCQQHPVLFNKTVYDFFRKVSAE